VPATVTPWRFISTSQCRPSARERGALLRLDHQHIGVAEFVVLVPVRRLVAADRAEVEDRQVVGAGRQ